MRGNVLTFALPDGTPVRVVETANADGSVHLEFTEGDKRDVLDINQETRAIMMNGTALMIFI